MWRAQSTPCLFAVDALLLLDSHYFDGTCLSHAPITQGSLNVISSGVRKALRIIGVIVPFACAMPSSRNHVYLPLGIPFICLSIVCNFNPSSDVRDALLPWSSSDGVHRAGLATTSLYRDVIISIGPATRCRWSRKGHFSTPELPLVTSCAPLDQNGVSAVREGYHADRNPREPARS